LQIATGDIAHVAISAKRTIGLNLPTLKPIRAQLGIAYRVLYRSMPKPMLQRSGVLTTVRVVVAAGVAEHVEVDAKAKTGLSTRSLDHLR
jgi:hypothetical protein